VTKVNLTINGQSVEAEASMTILEAAESAGIEIPTFCHDPHLVGVGACRICVVEVEGWGNLPASCVAPVVDGIVVNTESEKVIKARQANLSLLLANHPLDCLTCDLLPRPPASWGRSLSNLRGGSGRLGKLTGFLCGTSS